MSAVCPQGHTSQSTDYCDICGAPIAAGGAGAAGAGAAGAGAAGAGPGAGAAGAGAGAVASAAAGAASSSAAGGVTCPHCSTENVAGALFCEACGYDFTTGAMPRGATPTPTPEVAGSTPEVAGSSTEVAGSGTEVAGSGAEVAGSSAAVTNAGGDAATSGAAATSGGAAPLAPAVPLEWVAEVWVDPDWYAAQEAAEQPCPSPGLPTTVPLRVRSLLVGRVSRSRNIHPEIDCGTDAAVSRRQAQLTTDGTRWFVEDLQSSNGTFVGPASGPLPTTPLVPGQRRELVEDDRIYVGAWTRLVVRRATDEERAAG